MEVLWFASHPSRVRCSRPFPSKFPFPNLTTRISNGTRLTSHEAAGINVYVKKPPPGGALPLVDERRGRVLISGKVRSFSALVWAQVGPWFYF